MAVVSRRSGKRKKRRDGFLIANTVLCVEKGWVFVLHVYLTTPSHVQECPLLVSNNWSSGLLGVPVYVYSNTFLSEGPLPHHRNSVSIASSAPMLFFPRFLCSRAHT
jgi:hypothetical protein